MDDVLTVDDALAVLARSSLPTVLTEGSHDYRVMRKVEARLSDLGVNFLPVGGRENLLDVWRRMPAHRRASTAAIADLDLWVCFGIPDIYIADGLVFTIGYSIENDMFLDAGLLNLCDQDELTAFHSELAVVAAWYARQVERAATGLPFSISDHPSAVLQSGDITDELNANESSRKAVVEQFFAQVLRGKTLMQLLVRQLNRPGRFAKFGYKQIYEIGSANLGERFERVEEELRSFFDRSPDAI